MTDKEIIKALECCITKKNCTENCPYVDLKPNYFYCIEKSTLDALDLINRQQAEIERLTDRNKRLGEGVGWLLNNENGIELIRVEAIKEFAEKVENKLGIPFMVNNQVVGIVLDETIKEMVGADNG